MLNVIMLNVVILSAVMLSIVAPCNVLHTSIVFEDVCEFMYRKSASEASTVVTH
jgi:hypothetical protein